MIAGVFGEIAANAYDIVLAASGDDYELDRIAAALRKLTPEIGKTDPPGLLSCPLTWAAVCQLGHTFNGGSLGQWMPGPRLREWTLAELLKRTAVPSAEDLGPANAEQPAAEVRETATFRRLAAISSEADVDGGNAADDLRAAKVGQLVPRPYQAEGAAMIGAGGKFLLFDDPGVGKTVTTLLGLLAREARGEAVFPMVIIVPSWDVGDVWARHVADWAPGWPEPRYYKGPDRASLLPRRTRSRTLTDSQGSDAVLITTYATARLDAADARGPLARLKAASVVCDECVAHDTRIMTPRGYRPVWQVRHGDLVLGVDHVTGERAWATVRGASRSPLRETLTISGTSLTPDHPVWVSDYAHDGDPRWRGSSLCYATGYAENSHGYLRVVRAGDGEALAEQGASALLRSGVLSSLADVTAGVHGHAEHPREEGGSSPEHQESSRVPGFPRLRGIQPEPVPGAFGSLYPRARAGDPGSAGLAPVAGRQRHGAYRPAGSLAFRPWAELGTGTASQDRHEAGQRLPAGIQGGHRSPGDDGGDRRARTRARQSRDSPRPQEEGPAGVTWLDGHLAVERRNPERSLWNLETSTGNYFAGDFLVHNCHAIKNEDSQQSRAVRRIAAGAGTFVGLSGTPVTRDTGDIYPILAAMDPRSWPNRRRMVHRYCMTEEDDYGETIQGLLPLAEPEFFAVLTGQYRRASKADVLPQLPPKVYSVRRVELPPEWRRAYDGMAAEMLAELPEGGELEVMSVLAQLTRLSQLASSAADVTVTLELDEATGEERKKYGVKLRGPSWKADAMLEVLAERPHQQAAVFTVSRQLADIAGAALLAKGYRCAFITGGQSRRERQEGIDAFQAGERDVIVATAGAGSLGITLTAAGTVIMLQRSWELDKAMQPEDRAHRIGQRHDCVEVIDVVAKGTVDERVRELLRVKGGHLGSLVRDPRIARELLGGLR